MIPNRFPDEGQAAERSEYNTVDATLWYFEPIRAYYALVGDNALIVDLFPVLQEIVDWHVRGTRYQIHVDPSDGLLYAGEPGVQPIHSATLRDSLRSPGWTPRSTTGW